METKEDVLMKNRYMKMCLASEAIREVQNKTMMKHHYT
jgi:hypothetical protein